MPSYVYVVNFWVPFPASEYGGQIVLVARSDEEAVELLKQSNLGWPEYNDLIDNVVEKATRLELKDEVMPRIVDTFRT